MIDASLLGAASPPKKHAACGGGGRIAWMKKPFNRSLPPSAKRKLRFGGEAAPSSSRAANDSIDAFPIESS